MTAIDQQSHCYDKSVPFIISGLTYLWLPTKVQLLVKGWLSISYFLSIYLINLLCLVSFNVFAEPKSINYTCIPLFTSTNRFSGLISLCTMPHSCSFKMAQHIFLHMSFFISISLNFIWVG